MREIVSDSVKELENINLKTLWDKNIYRDPKRFHIAMMYPSLKSMNSISFNEIFSTIINKVNRFRLYIHIPFCTGNCTFCYFCKVQKFNEALINQYIDALIKEISKVGENIKDNYKNNIVSAIFFGGGSPSILSINNIDRILKAINNYFDLNKETEITIELHPEVIKKGVNYIESLKNIGFCRISIGVQSFNDNILKKTNRRHSKVEAISLFKLCRDKGFNSINIDLLSLLPYLTPEIWLDSLETIYSLSPESFTTYMTAIRKNSVLENLYNEQPYIFPNEYLTSLYRLMALRSAEKNGYSISLADWYIKHDKKVHFNQQNSESQKFDGTQYLAFGLGSVSYFNYHQYYNTPFIDDYFNKINSNNSPIWQGVELSKKERFVRSIYMSIKSGHINIEQISNHFNFDFNEIYKNEIKKLCELDLIYIEENKLKLTLKGYLYAEEVGIHFFTKETIDKIKSNDYKSLEEKEIIEEFDYLYKI